MVISIIYIQTYLPPTDLKWCARAYLSSRGHRRWSERPKGFLVAEKRGAGVTRVKDVSSVGRRSLEVARRRRRLLVRILIIIVSYSGRGGVGPG